MGLNAIIFLITFLGLISILGSIAIIISLWGLELAVEEIKNIAIILLGDISMLINSNILSSLLSCGSESLANDYLIENKFTIFIAIITDIIIFCAVMKKWGVSLKIIKRYFKRVTAIKQFIFIKKNIKNITKSINRLEEIKKLGINRSNIERTYNLYQLLTDISDKEQLQECFNVIDEKKKVLTEMDTIEYHIIEIAEEYKNIGDTKRCAYYLRNINENQSTSDIIKRKRECEEQLISCEEENETMKKWGVFLIFLAVITIFLLQIFL